MIEILHVASKDDWERAKHDGVYAPPSIESEGFVHCSTRAQLARTLDLHFGGRRDLVLLSLSAQVLGDALRWDRVEARADEGTFPHVYSAIPIAAVTHAIEIT